MKIIYNPESHKIPSLEKIVYAYLFILKKFRDVMKIGMIFLILFWLLLSYVYFYFWY